jgi:hypothetical protein
MINANQISELRNELDAVYPKTISLELWYRAMVDGFFDKIEKVMDKHSVSGEGEQLSNKGD